VETGCAWMALAFTVAAVWWFVHSIVQGRRRRREQDRRFERLEAEVATLRQRLDRELAGAPAAGAEPAAPTEGAPEPAETVPAEREPTATEAESPASEERAAARTVPASAWAVEDPLDAEEERPAPLKEPPAPPPPSDDEPSTSGPPGPGIDWEQWLGVRGVAVLGGIVLALAAVYFVRHSIEQGWVPPVVRVSLLMLAGVVSMVVTTPFPATPCRAPRW